MVNSANNLCPNIKRKNSDENSQLPEGKKMACDNVHENLLKKITHLETQLQEMKEENYRLKKFEVAITSNTGNIKNYNLSNYLETKNQFDTSKNK